MPNAFKMPISLVARVQNEYCRDEFHDAQAYSAIRLYAQLGKNIHRIGVCRKFKIKRLDKNYGYCDAKEPRNNVF